MPWKAVNNTIINKMSYCDRKGHWTCVGLMNVRYPCTQIIKNLTDGKILTRFTVLDNYKPFVLLIVLGLLLHAAMVAKTFLSGNYV